MVVNDNGTLKNAFVWVKSGLPDKTWQVPTTAVALDQNGCMYKPHVIGVMAGQNIEIKNNDPTNHNIHPLPQDQPGMERVAAARAAIRQDAELRPRRKS